MEPEVQYATTAHDVRIAYSTTGKDKPLLYMVGGPWNHIELWEIPECRRWYERLAEDRMLVRYDVRGTGHSDRNVTDFSLDANVRDLEAVVNQLGLYGFDLLAGADAGPTAIAYAVELPEEVSHLILWCAWARGSEITSSPRIQAWLSLIDQD